MKIDADQQEKYIMIWEKVIDTQMHFNEMSVKSRQLGLTFVAAALGVGVVLLSRGDAFSFPIKMFGVVFQIHIAAILMFGAAIAMNAVKQLDLKVYHRMLRGSVAFGEDFEENYMKQIFDLDKGMTQAISHFSRFDDPSVLKMDSGKYSYIGKIKVTAEEKIKLFYRSTTNYLIIGAIAILVITNWGSIESVVGKFKAHIDESGIGTTISPVEGLQ